MFNLLPLKRMGSKVRSKSRRVSSIFFEILSDRDCLDVKIRIYIYIVDIVARIDFKEFKKFREIELSTKYIILDWPRRCSIVRPCSTPKKWQQSIPTILQRCPNTCCVSTLEIETSLKYFRRIFLCSDRSGSVSVAE